MIEIKNFYAAISVAMQSGSIRKLAVGGCLFLGRCFPDQRKSL